MEKIPCIKCDDTLFDYINPYLEDFGYNIKDIASFNTYPILFLNYDGVIGDCTNMEVDYVNNHNRELVTNVEEFLERAAKLMGKTYEKKNIMKINGIEIKPGMVIEGKHCDKREVLIAFPLKSGIGFVTFYEKTSWSKNIYSLLDVIESIRDVSDENNLLSGKLLWEKPEEVVVTMQEIADKFNIPVSQLRIKE